MDKKLNITVRGIVTTFIAIAIIASACSCAFLIHNLYLRIDEVQSKTNQMKTQIETRIEIEDAKMNSLRIDITTLQETINKLEVK